MVFFIFFIHTPKKQSRKLENNTKINTTTATSTELTGQLSETELPGAHSDVANITEGEDRLWTSRDFLFKEPINQFTFLWYLALLALFCCYF